MNKHLRSLAPISLGFGFLVACSGNSGTPLTDIAFCQQLAAKECEGVATACGATQASCQTARTKVCSDTYLSQESAARPFRPENVGACLDMASTVYKKTTPIVPSDRDALAVACNRVFSGKKKALAQCTTSDYECDVNLICDMGQNPPLCATKTLVTGMFCGNPGDTCPAAQYCVTAGSLRMCVAKKASGEACAADAPCVDSLYCDPTANTCAAKVVVSGKCTQNSDCAPEVPYCNPYAGSVCGRGFEPSTFNPECGAFGNLALAADGGTAM